MASPVMCPGDGVGLEGRGGAQRRVRALAVSGKK